MTTNDENDENDEDDENDENNENPNEYRDDEDSCDGGGCGNRALARGADQLFSRLNMRTQGTSHFQGGGCDGRPKKCGNPANAMTPLCCRASARLGDAD